MNTNQDYIVRCDRAGVFFGKIKERNGSEVTMTEVRKLWSWDGLKLEEIAGKPFRELFGECEGRK